MIRRTALISGGTGGLGTAMCRALADAGHTVVANDLPSLETQCKEWQAKQRDDGYAFELAFADVTDYDACAAMVEDLQARVGTVEILVNNAGITRDGVFKKMSLERWQTVLDASLGGMFNLTRQVFEGMLEGGWGRVINISSLNGQKGQFGQANYSAAKAGAHGLTMALAQEGARNGVTVNSISPGYIGTEMVMAIPEDVRNSIVAQIPVGRLGEPDEIAHVVRFLTDEKSGFITGANIDINGGQWMH
ncbi:MAG: acetoacetyl-CoA reductase [Gammaproteobacteria bacterium]|nr:acetoacetyl-CoA reductase [Gammaproteobacteria bacterium]